MTNPPRRGFLLSSPQRTQRSQVFDRKLDQVSIFVEPLVARQAPDKLLAAIVDFDKRLFALDAVLDHRLVSRPAARERLQTSRIWCNRSPPQVNKCGPRSFLCVGHQVARRSWSPMANCPKECRRQALACIQLALDSALPKDKEMFARLATTWITLANDLEAIEAQLKTKRQTPPEGIPLRRTGT